MSRTKKKTTIRHKAALTAETSMAHNTVDNPSSSPLTDNNDVTADRGIGHGASTTEALDQNGLASIVSIKVIYNDLKWKSMTKMVIRLKWMAIPLDRQDRCRPEVFNT
jgi:hypothetical protein